MINLATPEVWLVCGSQHLYGPGPLEQVAAHAREIAGAFARVAETPVEDRLQGPADDAGRNREALPRREFRSGLRRPDPLDAHVFAVENVDPRAEHAARSRSSISTPSSIAICRGTRSTWTS